MAAGILTLRSGVFARWVGLVAIVGAVSFLFTFLALIAGTGEDSVFGYGFFPGVLAVVVWSIATSVALYRAVALSGGPVFVKRAGTRRIRTRAGSFLRSVI